MERETLIAREWKEGMMTWAAQLNVGVAFVRGQTCIAATYTSKNVRERCFGSKKEPKLGMDVND